LTASGAVPLAGDAQEQVNDVIRRRGLLLPAVENELWHAQPVELLLTSSRTVSDQLQQGKNFVVARTGRLKNPMIRPLSISLEQQRQIRSVLEPGDILLTYAAGYVVNLVIPGNFKHAVTFVGTDAERRRAGLPPEMLLAIAGPNQQRLANVLNYATIEGGASADVVEAVAEGVQLINLFQMLDARVNRLIVLRPRLSHVERAEQLRDVLSYVGDEFDFSFDLTDASDQVCTEVVYRSLQGRGGIELPLSEHAGRLTLPPDDIMRCCLPGGGNRFECILLVDEAPEAAGAARILGAAEAQAWIARAIGPDLPAPAAATRALR
jgi:ribosomal protein S18 acetylase RimI-like enzyme